jgi:hypothetical protein
MAAGSRTTWRWGSLKAEPASRLSAHTRQIVALVVARHPLPGPVSPMPTLQHNRAIVAICLFTGC